MACSPSSALSDLLLYSTPMSRPPPTANLNLNSAAATGGVVAETGSPKELRTSQQGNETSALNDRLTVALDSRKRRQMLRSLQPGPPTEAPLVDFSSNDYLSLSQSPSLRSFLLSTLSEPSFLPYGPPSSRLLDGNSPHHLLLESRLAAFFAAPSALLFNSGFDANVGLWTCIPGPDDYIVFDELVHASMHDGMRGSRVPKEKRRAFKHNDVAALEAVLREIATDDGVRGGKKSVWIGVESLYSMDGDLAPLRQMVEAVERLLPAGNGHLVVDEAHSSGLYGLNGRGLVASLGLEKRVTVRVHTFGKALACSGAAALATPLVLNYLINYARPLIYSTAMTRMSAVMALGAIAELEKGAGVEPAAHVHHLAHLFVSILLSSLPSPSPVQLPPHLLHLPSLHSASHLPHPPTSPIIPLLTPSPRPLAAFLREKGFLTRPITYPTVPYGEERVRLCLHAENTEEEVRGLAEAVVQWAKKASEIKAKL